MKTGDGLIEIVFFQQGSGKRISILNDLVVSLATFYASSALFYAYFRPMYIKVMPLSNKLYIFFCQQKAT